MLEIIFTSSWYDINGNETSYKFCVHDITMQGAEKQATEIEKYFYNNALVPLMNVSGLKPKDFGFDREVVSVREM